MSQGAEALSLEFTAEELGLDYSETEIPKYPHLVLIYSQDADELLGAHVDSADDEYDLVHEDSENSDENNSVPAPLGKNTARLKPGEELRLITQAKAGNLAAKQRVVEANLGLAYSLAGNYSIKGMEFDDIVHNGVVGLLLAVDKFDQTRSYNFGTYARYQIKTSIFEGIYKTSRTVRIPLTQFRNWRELALVEDEFMQKHRRSPNLMELVEATGWDSNKISEVRVGGNDAVSLSAPIGHGDLVLEDTVKSDGAQPIEVIINTEQRALVEKTLGSLSDREAVVIRGYFGFNLQNDPASLEKIAKQLGGISRTSVGQIKKSALEKLDPHLAELDLDV